MIIKTSYPFMKPPPSARLIRGHRLAQGLAGCWPFSTGGGLQAFDSSEYGNTGTFGAGAASPSWVAGKFGSAISFDGDEYIDTGVTSLPGTSLFCDSTQKFSVIIWFNVLPGEQGTIIAKAGADVGNRTFQLLISGIDALAVTLRGEQNDEHTGTQLGDDADDGLWHCAAVTWDGSTALGYYDGIYISTLIVGTKVEETSQNIIIGARTGGTAYHLTGLIDIPSIYNRALSAGELAELYWRPFCMLERRARTALMSGYEVVAPPTGIAAYTHHYQQQL